MKIEARVSAVSTDVIGVVGRSPQALRAVLPPEANIKYVEVVGLRGGFQEYLQAFEDQGFTVSHIHGPMGGAEALTWVQKMKWNAVSAMLIPTLELARRFPGYNILIHEPEARLPKRIEGFKKYHTPFVWVENHSAQYIGFTRAGEMAQALKSSGVSASVMFDVAHHIGPARLRDGRDFHIAWASVLRTLNLSHDFIGGIHFPVGTNTDDAVPIETMPYSMLSDFAAVIPQSVHTVVVENQQEGKQYGLGKRDIFAVKKRNGVIFERLQKAGIVNFN